MLQNGASDNISIFSVPVPNERYAYTGGFFGGKLKCGGFVSSTFIFSTEQILRE
jgi:hypothetical protein